MQVNLYGTPCIPGVFFYCFGHTEEQNLAPMSPRKYAISILKYQKFSGEGPLSLWIGGHPLPTPYSPRRLRLTVSQKRGSLRALSTLCAC